MSAESATTDPQDGQGAVRPLHTYLAASYAVLGLYSVNVDGVPPSTVWLPLMGTLGVAAAAHLAARLVWRNPLRAAAGATLFIVWLMSFGHVHRGLVWAEGLHGLGAIRLRYYLIGWAALLAMLLVLVARGWWDRRAIHGWLNRIGGALIAVALLNIAWHHGLTRAPGEWATTVDAGRPLEDSELAAVQKAIISSDSRPDIYYLVFDWYGSNETLRRDYSFDNDGLRRELEARGFHWFSDSFCNYPKTIVSMSAALNLEYQPESADYGYYYNRLQNHAVGRLLRSAGYRYYHLGNWYAPLRSNPHADYSFPVSLFPSEFAELVYGTTPLDKFWSSSGRTSGDILRQFDSLIEVVGEDGPKFTYAHFILPHKPFLFSENGPKTMPQLDHRSEDEQYLDSVKYANKRILEVIDTIVANTPQPPIIAVQADEGPWLTAGDDEKSDRHLMLKRCGIISAVLLPGIEAESLPTRLSPANTFRLILQHEFNAGIQLLGERIHYWRYPQRSDDGNASGRYSFIDVTTRLIDEEQ